MLKPELTEGHFESIWSLMEVTSSDLSSGNSQKTDFENTLEAYACHGTENQNTA